ncbi:GGDEF domain-containing protein [Vibrio ulleungensis]|uniref:diguanylate cyclase n=1 Tax=Vibrio ulleungensis TaxID=2807619 RepID=A0ABS2HR27_9VIBR|nr:GGDEF domain-containing protein [Vibrio ulleungensis]MBM7038504.1 diguanylate cyclase [Vibrio ulleungensis]
MSLRKIITFFVLLGSLVPTYIVGTLLIDRHAEYQMDQKQLKLEASSLGIETTVKHELSNIANLTSWYSRDRQLITSTNNILYGAVITQKLSSFKQLADPITSTFLLDSQWQPMYESNGSLFHFEKSQLLTSLKQHSAIYQQGKTYHTEFTNEELVIDGGQQGIALITPLLSYTLLPGSEYEPKGYLVVLVSYDALIALSTPYLFAEESIAIRYLPTYSESVDGAKVLELTSDNLFAPLYFQVEQQLSDRARETELRRSQQKLYQSMVVILVITLVLGLVISQGVLYPVRDIEHTVRKYQQGNQRYKSKKRFQFSEFKQLLDVIDKLWSRIHKQMRELEIQNIELQKAHSEVQQSNLQLENFNQTLERSVDEKTIELRELLNREEHYQQQLVRVIDFFSNRAGIAYRSIPTVCNLFLSQLFSHQQILFSFEKPSVESCEPVYSVDGQVLGYIQLDRNTLSEQQQMLLVIFAKQLSTWLELEVLARWDPLSSTLNRKAFEEDLEYYKRRTQQRSSRNLSLMMIDINGLKTINDTYGHDTGDRLIQTMVSALIPVCSKKAVIYRVGGDEFVLLIRDHSADQLSELTMQIEQSKGASQLKLPDSRLYKVSYSIGVASSLEAPLDALYARADANMYRDKRDHYVERVDEAEPSL